MKKKMTMTLETLVCLRCGYGKDVNHPWIPRGFANGKPVAPTVCPKCKSPYYNKPRQVAAKAK